MAGKCNSILKKPFDVSLTVLLPILLGIGIYLSKLTGGISPLIRNYLPDGLWAFAFVSSILIIWDRKINPLWIIFTFISFIVFEVLQDVQIINGTADYWDVICYFLFSVFALLLNKKIIKYLNYEINR